MTMLLSRHSRSVLLAALLIATACGRGAPRLAEGVTDSASPEWLAAIVHDLMPRLERLSGLDRVDVIRARTQSRQDARAYVERRLDQEMPPEVLEGVRRTYVLLGLLPDTLDLRALLLDLYTEQVLGYYDPGTRTLYVVEGADAASLRPVLAHELVHALQDQHTDLDSLIARDRGNDRQTAAHAAMEGHSMVVMFTLLAEEATGRRIDPTSLPAPSAELGPAMAAQIDQYPVFRRAPPIVRETLLFPYIGGSDFVHALWSGMAPLDRYPAPLDSLLPVSTQQVLQPVERFVGERVDPIEMRFEGGPALPPGAYENTLGQFEIEIFLEHHLGSDARSLARPWRGDRFALVDASGGPALVWVSLWESGTAADAFAGALRLIRPPPGHAHHVETGSELGQPSVRLIVAPGADLPELRPALAGAAVHPAVRH